MGTCTICGAQITALNATISYCCECARRTEAQFGHCPSRALGGGAAECELEKVMATPYWDHWRNREEGQPEKKTGQCWRCPCQRSTRNKRGIFNDLDHANYVKDKTCSLCAAPRPAQPGGREITIGEYEDARRTARCDCGAGRSRHDSIHSDWCSSVGGVQGQVEAPPGFTATKHLDPYWDKFTGSGEKCWRCPCSYGSAMSPDIKACWRCGAARPARPGAGCAVRIKTYDDGSWTCYCAVDAGYTYAGHANSRNQPTCGKCGLLRP